MAINLVVAVTDYDWFQFLRIREDWPEINFWAPSATNFRALQEGELFLFKLHSPHNFIVGGGVFAHAMTLPCSLAWETFGPADGASDLTQMRARIMRYRDVDVNDRTDFHYYKLQGNPLILPPQTRLRPDPAALHWHNSNRFFG
jgi:putative restriction endonuclease